MERLKVHPVKKQEAPPEARALLDDVERTMGLPWPPASWLTYAQFPGVMRLFWERLKPSVATEESLEDALGITARAYREVGKWYRPRFRPSLPPEVRQRIEWEIDAFEFGNPQLLIQQAALSRALRGSTVGRERPAEPRRHPIGYRRSEIRLIDEQSAPPEVGQLYADIRQTLDVPVLSSDYQALGKWPAFLGPASEDAKPWLLSDEYSRLLLDLSLMAAEAAGRLTQPLRIGQDELLAALPNAGDRQVLQQAVGLFTHLLPGLIANDALFRLGIAAGRPVAPLRPEGAPAPPA